MNITNLDSNCLTAQDMFEDITKDFLKLNDNLKFYLINIDIKTNKFENIPEFKLKTIYDYKYIKNICELDCKLTLLGDSQIQFSSEDYLLIFKKY